MTQPKRPKPRATTRAAKPGQTSQRASPKASAGARRPRPRSTPRARRLSWFGVILAALELTLESIDEQPHSWRRGAKAPPPAARQCQKAADLAMLGMPVDQTYTLEQLRAARRRVMVRVHPDRNNSEGATKLAAQINAAFDRLSIGARP